MDVGCAAAEYLRIAPARGDHQHEQHQAEQGGGLAQRRVAEQVVDEPADDQRAEADSDGRRRGQLAARCDQVQAGVEVVHHHQQRHARQPGGVGLPLEPVQVFRHLRRRQLVFLQVVDTATVDGPEIARQALTRVGAVEVVLQPDEIEGSTDPGDANDHVNPADTQVQPFGQMGVHLSCTSCGLQAAVFLLIGIGLSAARTQARQRRMSQLSSGHVDSRWGSRRSC